MAQITLNSSGVASSGSLLLQTNGTTTQATVDTSGNLGLGVTPSAWGTSGAVFKALELGKVGNAIFGLSSGPELEMTSNAYYNSGWKYANTGTSALRFSLNGDTAGAFSWNIAGSGTAGNAISFTQAMTLDASGNLGVGTTSPVNRLHVAGTNATLKLEGTSTSFADYINFYNGADKAYVGVENSSGTGIIATGAAYGMVVSTASTNPLCFGTNSTERARIDSSGNLLVGSTSAAWTGGGGGAIQFKGITSHAGQNGAFQNNGINLEWRSGALRVWVDTTDLGTVQFASDYRIKKDIATQTLPALNRIAQLRPVTFEFGDYGDLFKGDNVAREGFIAHELAAVIPSAVDGEKDAENQIQSLRLDALCSVMVKAIQEQQAIIESLTARITALEA